MSLETALPAALELWIGARRTAASVLLGRTRGAVIDSAGIPSGGRAYSDELQIMNAAAVLRTADVLEALSDALDGDVPIVPPAAPSGLSAVVTYPSATVARIAASWIPGTGGPLTEYGARRTGETSDTNLTATSIEWDVVRPVGGSETYTISVRALGPGGSSGYATTTAIVAVQPPALAPGVPTGLGTVVTYPSDTTATITATWAAPTDGGPVTQYGTRRTGESSDTLVAGLSKAWTVTRPTGASASYTIQVRAMGIGGNSDYASTLASVAAEPEDGEHDDLFGPQIFTTTTTAVDVDGEGAGNDDGSTVRVVDTTLSDFTIVSTGLVNPNPPLRDVHALWCQGTTIIEDGHIDHLGMGIVAFGGDDDTTVINVRIDNWGGGYEPGGNYGCYIQGKSYWEDVIWGPRAAGRVGDFSGHFFGRETGTGGIVVRDCEDESTARWMVGGDQRTNSVDIDGFTKATGPTQLGWSGGHQNHGELIALNLDIDGLEVNSNWETVEISGTWSYFNRRGGPNMDPMDPASWPDEDTVIVNGVTVKS